MNINTNKIFFSVAQGLGTDAGQHAKVRDLLHNLGVPYFETVGAYKGVTEQGFCVFTNSVYDLNRYLGLIKELATREKQESILVVHNDNVAELVLLSDYTVLPIGTFRAVSEAEAKAAPAWTRALAGETYYVAG
jgi:hypothetical protein